jgi:hypothetical protein
MAVEYLIVQTHLPNPSRPGGRKLENQKLVPTKFLWGTRGVNGY